MDQPLLERLNGPDKAGRLAALEELTAQSRRDEADNAPTKYVNNHIHTTYSFSPYSPAMAAYRAWESGLQTAGIMDHDSIAGAEEFAAAGRIIGIATTAGFECRCSMEGTPFAGRRINNPDQKSVAYLAMHGIPRRSIGTAQAFLTPYRERRNLRNRAMTDRLNDLLARWGLGMDFDRDVAPLSQWEEGGSITERHILFALASRMMDQIGRGKTLLTFLEEKLSISASGSIRTKLLEEENPMYSYYLLGLLKSQMVARFYIDAGDECPPVDEFIRLSRELGAIPAYAYLGDVEGSVTGDKKDQTFEDAYLDDLVEWLADSGFLALTYMPTRNSPRQLERIMALCDAHGLFQISGEDINSPFQSFRCEALEKPEFQHLIASTWALIGHERAAADDPSGGMFSPETLAAMPSLSRRIDHFAAIGRA